MIDRAAETKGRMMNENMMTEDKGTMKKLLLLLTMMMMLIAQLAVLKRADAGAA
jgi:hypothetical protein